MAIFKEHVLRSRPYSGGSVRENKNIVKLSSNENPLGPSPKAVEAMRGVLDGLHEYQFESDAALTGPVAHSVFGHLSGFDESFAARILPANGGMELLDIICRGFLEPGDSCLISSPTFMAYQNFAELAGGRVIDVPLLKENLMLDVPAILAAVNEKVRILFISNPNNPTGAIFPERDIRKLLDGLPEHVIVVYDEVYHHYVDRRDYVSASTLISEGRPVIGIHSFSKAYGLAGIRLAYLFSTPSITEYLRHFRRPFMIPALSMLGGLAALEDYEHLSNTVRVNAIEKKWLYEQFSKAGIEYWKSDANFILIRPPVSSKVFCTSLLKRGVMVRNAEPLGAEGLVRITVGNKDMNHALINAIQNLKFNK